MCTLEGGLSVTSYTAECPAGFRAVRLNCSVVCFCWPRALRKHTSVCVCECLSVCVHVCACVFARAYMSDINIHIRTCRHTDRTGMEYIPTHACTQTRLACYIYNTHMHAACTAKTGTPTTQHFLGSLPNWYIHNVH